ncbi:MFS transporter [Actinomadura sp. DC4]|uniref:MFS transporter n=1 Tax=Actinomadura sp. DC4 TaxID=3055069 RepID=UPI0025B11FB0|nr:MFS transporter [Actinomadura sp. DC4]MDN3354913.1 MFS transporter [Actinomadura sp. DC4]
MAVPRLPGLLLSACVARLAGRMFGLAIVLYVLAHFHSAVLAGWVAFASIAPGFAISPIAGALLDRTGEAVAITIDLAASAMLLSLLVVFSRMGVMGAPLLLTLTVAYSLTSPLSAAGIRALIPRLVPANALDQANALDTGSYALINVLGPFLVGPLFALTGADPTMVVIAALYGAGALSLLAVGSLTWPAVSAPSGTLLREAAAGLGYLVRHRTLRGLAVAYSLYQASWGVLVVAVPVYVVRHPVGGASTDAVTGLLWASAGLAGVVGALVTGRVRTLGRERLVIGASALATGVVIFPVSAAFGVAGLAAGLAVVGLLEGPLDVGVLTLRQRRADPGWLGRILAVSFSLNMAGLPIGSAIGGLLVSWSLSAAFVVAAATSLLSALATYALIPRKEAKRDLSYEPADPPNAKATSSR